MSASSPPASEVMSWSQVSSAPSASADQARIFIQLTNGIRFVVFVDQRATIAELHAKAVQRAASYGFDQSLQDFFLQTTKPPPIALHGEDEVISILDLTENNTFSLCENLPQAIAMHLKNPLDNSSLTKQFVPHAQFHSTGADTIYIRWIDLDGALSASQLIAIKPDHVAYLRTMSLDELHNIACEKFGKTNDLTSSTSDTQQVRMFIKEGLLSTKGNSVTLEKLNLLGTKNSPLDIFIDVCPTDMLTSVGDYSGAKEAGSLWGFPTTKRGIATFLTSLKMLVHELGAATIDNFLEVLFEMTHFPPLVLAFRYLFENNLEKPQYAQYLRMLAHACHILCLQIAPNSTCPSPEMALQSSRQLLAWMYQSQSGMHPSVPEGSKLTSEICVTLKKDFNQADSSLQYVPEHHELKIPRLNEEGGGEQDIVVSIKKRNEDLANFLGKAIYKGLCGGSPYDYYLDVDLIWADLSRHRKTPLPQPVDFDLLLRTTSLAEKMRLVGPLQLGGLQAKQLPVITLGSDGYVSLYEQEYHECATRYKTWNPISGTEIMKNMNPGQYLLQKLEPIISERKKDGTWELDAWGEWNQAAEFGAPDEAVVICMDISSSMGFAMPSSWMPGEVSEGALPSRLTECKEFFKNLGLRISAMRLATYLGLVTFSGRSQVFTNQGLTPVHLNFEEQVEKLLPLSRTAVFDGINQARIMLEELQRKHSNVKCRIIVLTDGMDNESSCRAETVAAELCLVDIALDSIVIGTDYTADLFKISKITGGYAFQPKTQQAFFQIFLLETVVDIRTRPDLVKQSRHGIAWGDFEPKTPDMPTPFDFPPCRPHPNQEDSFIALSDADKYLTRQARQATPTVAPSVHSMATRSATVKSMSTGITGTTLSSGAGGISRIILNEVREAIHNPHHDMDIYVSERNMGFWKIAMQGPTGTPYANGVFLLYLEIGDNFPLKPPAARFITPVLHPNITKVRQTTMQT